MPARYTGVGRGSLIAKILEQEKEIDILKEEVRKRGILLRGWTCKACRVFNSDEKEALQECRACGAAR